MKCRHYFKKGGLMERVSEYIQAPQLAVHALASDTAHSIARIYFSYR